MTENDIAKRLTANGARAKADECRAMAKVAIDKSHRIMLNSIAQTWDNIAKTADEAGAALADSNDKDGLLVDIIVAPQTRPS